MSFLSRTRPLKPSFSSKLYEKSYVPGASCEDASVGEQQQLHEKRKSGLEF